MKCVRTLALLAAPLLLGLTGEAQAQVAAGTTVQTPLAGVTAGAAANPNAWRYRYHNNQWWYYHPNSTWSVWNGNAWAPHGAYSAGYRGYPGYGAYGNGYGYAAPGPGYGGYSYGNAGANIGSNIGGAIGGVGGAGVGAAIGGAAGLGRPGR